MILMFFWKHDCCYIYYEFASFLYNFDWFYLDFKVLGVISVSQYAFETAQSAQANLPLVFYSQLKLW